MNKKDRSQALERVTASRIVRDKSIVQSENEEVVVAREGPVTIDVANVGTYTVLCSPEDKRAMAVGFLFSEGIIDSVDDLALFNECEDDPAVLRVRLQAGLEQNGGSKRNLLIVSSCGMCGSESIEEKLENLPRVEQTFEVAATRLNELAEELKKRQKLFAECGGTHAAGIFDKSGEFVAIAEDIGRHNALDKAIGQCLLRKATPAGTGVVLSGRVSLEMVGKCARAGIELISAVSAPTSLAIEAARRCQITLAAFVRERRATVFCGPERVLL